MIINRYQNIACFESAGPNTLNPIIVYPTV